MAYVVRALLSLLVVRRLMPLTLASALALGAAAALAAPGRVLWDDTYDFALNSDAALAVAAYGDRVFVAGLVTVAPGNPDFVVRAYHATTGALLWQDRYDAAGNRDFALAIAADGARVFAVGAVADHHGNEDFFVRAYDYKTGQVLWQDRFDPAHRFDRAQSVVASAGRVFVSGFVTNAADNFDWIVRAYDGATGRLLWQDQYDHAGGSDVVQSVATDGLRLYAVGGVSFGPGRFGRLIRAYDTRTGARLWEDLGAPVPSSQALAVDVQGGRVFVSGITFAPLFPMFVRAYDVARGALLWETMTTLADHSYGPTSLLAHDGRVFAAGMLASDLIDNTDLFVTAYSADTGAMLWSDRVDGGPTPVDEARGLAAHASSLIVVGTTGGVDDNVDFRVRAYDTATGALRWEDLVDRGMHDAAAAVTVRNGRVYAVGALGTSDDVDFFVRAYEGP